MHPSWGMSPWPQQILPSLQMETGPAWDCSTFSPETVGLVLLKAKIPSVGEVLLQLVRAEQPGSSSCK